MYDTGPRFSERLDAGRAAVVPFLRERGIAHIDALVVSHGDNDHLGGLRSLLAEVSVGRILTSVPQEIRHRRTVPCEAGQHWRWEGVSFKVLHPEAGATGSDNERSCVLRVSTGARAVLIPGDIEHGAEARPGSTARSRIARRGPGRAPSRQQDLIDPGLCRGGVSQLRGFPRGLSQSLGFPAPEVRERYATRGAGMLGTAETGAIRFRIGDEVGSPVRYREETAYWNAR